MSSDVGTRSAVISLAECFAEIEDPRVARTRLHSLEEIQVLAMLAVIAGAEGWEDIEDYGKHKLSLLRRFLKFSNGIPSHDTISRIFRALKHGVFQTAFMTWVRTVHSELGCKQIAIDGKSLRRSHDHASLKKMLHSVSAWSVENHLVLGELAVDKKSNEITAIPLLFDQLELEGAIVTIDAMGCQKEIAAKMTDGGGEYVLGAKDNHPKLCEAMTEHFVAAHEADFQGFAVRHYQTHEKGHGRTARPTHTIAREFPVLWQGSPGPIQQLFVASRCCTCLFAA